HNKIRYVPASTIENYSKTCATDPGENCVPWIRRFIGLYPSASQEVKAIFKNVPQAEKMAKPNNNWDRLVVSYRAPDEDQVAFDSAFEKFIDKDFDEAIEKFRNFLDQYPKSA